MASLRSIAQEKTLSRLFEDRRRVCLTAQHYILLVLVADVLISGCVGLASHHAYRIVAIDVYGFKSAASAVSIGVVAGILYCSFAKSSGLYSLPSLIGATVKIGSVLLCSVSAVLLLAAMLFIVRAGAEVSRGTFLFFAPLFFIFLTVNQSVARVVASGLIRSGTLSGPSVVLIGDQSELAQIDRRTLMATYGFREVGRIELTSGEPVDPARLNSLLNLSRNRAASRIVVSMKWDDEARLCSLREGLRQSALPATLLPDAGVRRLMGDQVALAAERLPPVIELQRAPLTRSTQLFKRCIDVTVAMAALLLLAPLLLVTAVAIRLDSPGPIIFKQRRHGFDRRPFFIYKFRSMSVLEDGSTIVQASRTDDRVTRVGRVLRKTSIDELPQLFNVLLGNMSLVGPRPHAIAHDDAYSLLVERYSHRHHVKPGITGWAQVNGARGQTIAVQHMQRRIDLDLWYIDHSSIWLDLMILGRTCFEIAKIDAF